MEVDTISLFWNQIQQQEREYKELQQQVQNQAQIELQYTSEISCIDAEIVEWRQQFTTLISEVAKKEQELQVVNSQIVTKEAQQQQLISETNSIEKQVDEQNSDVESIRLKLLDLVLLFQQKFEDDYSTIPQRLQAEVEKNISSAQENRNRVDPIRLDISKFKHLLATLEEECHVLVREVAIKEQIYFELADELEQLLQIERQQLLMIGETFETNNEYSDVSFLKQIQFIERQKEQLERSKVYYEQLISENSAKLQELLHNEAKFKTLYEKIQLEVKEIDEKLQQKTQHKNAILDPPFVTQQTMLEQFTVFQDQDISSIASPPKKKSPYLSTFNIPSTAHQMQNLVVKTGIERRDSSSSGIVQRAINSSMNTPKVIPKASVVNNLAKFAHQEKENPTKWNMPSLEDHATIPKQVKQSPRVTHSQPLPGFQSALNYSSMSQQQVSQKRTSSGKSKSQTEFTPKMKQSSIPQSPKFQFKRL